MNYGLFFERVRHVGERAAASVPVRAHHHCALCDRWVRRFLPYRSSWLTRPAVLTELDIVGSDIQNFECPACGCHDRERHLLLFLRATGLAQGLTGSSVLHFAPERRLSRWIHAAGPKEYVKGDLFPTEADVRRIDLMAIDSPSSAFDWVIANHVLEHVADDAQALREIRRVLRPGGYAILQTPFSNRLATKFEDEAIRSESARLAAYGQEDHCRLYGADFSEFVASHGFRALVRSHGELLPAVDPLLAGVNAREPFLLFARAEE